MKVWVAAALAMLATNACAAQDLPGGAEAYREHCLTCHGVDGQGDGPMADQLEKRPADLTGLSRGNGGEFPYWRVFAVIDGRLLVPGHGDRDMPVWGRDFLPEDVRRYGKNGGEFATEERIHALAAYVRTLQR